MIGTKKDNSDVGKLLRKGEFTMWPSSEEACKVRGHNL